MNNGRKIRFGSFIYKTEIDAKCDDAIKNQCFTLGYLDGYFDEMIYENCIEKSDKNNKYYNRGVNEGMHDKLEVDITKWKQEKNDFILKLARYDRENNIEDRNINGNYMDLYLSFKYESSKNTRRFR